MLVATLVRRVLAIHVRKVLAVLAAHAIYVSQRHLAAQALLLVLRFFLEVQQELVLLVLANRLVRNLLRNLAKNRASVHALHVEHVLQRNM